MTATLLINDYHDINGLKRTPMVVLSILFHISFLAGILILPDAIPSRRIDGPVYEVDLVEMPEIGVEGNVPYEGVTEQNQRGKNIAMESSPAKRIQEIPAENNESEPLVIAKKTTPKKIIETKTLKMNSKQLIDQAISKIEKDLKTDNGAHLDKALSKLQKDASVEKAGAKPAGGGVGSVSGLTIRIYQMEVENRIKGNWAYPVAADEDKQLEAVVSIRVKSDGTILNSKFIRPSSDSVFDQSVIKAIERSNPLPPFPEGFPRSYDDIEINFNLKDLS